MAVWGPETTVPVVRRISAPAAYLCGLTWDGVRLWHSDQGAERIYAISPDSGEVLRTLVCPDVRADLAYHDGWLCQVGGRPKRLVLVDPLTGKVGAQKPVPPSNGRLCGVEAAAAGVWMCLRAPAVVQLRDFDTMRVLRELPVPGNPSGLTCVSDVVFYSDFEDGAIRAVDATGTLLAAVPVEGRPVGMTWDGEHLWYCDFAAREIKAIRPAAVLGTG